MKPLLLTLTLATAAAGTANAEIYRPSVVRDSTIVGAVAGALIGGHNDDRWAQGAVIGAAAGALVGTVVDNSRTTRVERVVVTEPAPVVYVERPARRVVYVESCPPPVVVSRPVVVINAGRHHGRHHHHHYRHHRHRW